MCEQRQQQMMNRVDRRMINGDRRKAIEEERLEVVDLSGMSLETLPHPSLNLATICKLYLSNNDLQVYTHAQKFPGKRSYNNLLFLFFANPKKKKKKLIPFDPPPPSLIRS